MRPRQFTCRDCGWDVESWAEAEDICQQCLWLRDIKDPAEREKLRRWLEERP